MPRKTATETNQTRRPSVASMRPRPDAAENPRQVLAAAGVPVASMRPRPDAAENPRFAAAAAGSGRASMRPRPDAAEN